MTAGNGGPDTRTDLEGLHRGEDGPAAGDRSEERLLWLTRDLAERVKELNCLYGISKVVDKTESIDGILQGVVELLPASWQYPEVTCARIRLRKKEFQTANFRETEWKQAESIIANGRPIGRVEVCYLAEKPRLDEGPFLAEERHLIHAVAERLGKVIARKQAEERLRSLYRREKELREGLQAEMRSRVDLTRQLVHELKTPLTSLVATSQLLRDETRDERLRKLAGYVWDSARSLDSRVNELQDLARGELGMLEMDTEPLDLEGLLRSILEETKALADQSGLALLLEAQTPLPPVRGDTVRVRQVVLNLVGNAFKFAEGSGAVTIRAIPGESEVTVEVHDQGPGISRQQQKHLFEPYYAVVHQGRQTGGLGIGLSLCKMLVEAQGGRIWVRSRPGKGASFFFTLPRLGTAEDSSGEAMRNHESADC